MQALLLVAALAATGSFDFAIVGESKTSTR